MRPTPRQVAAAVRRGLGRPRPIASESSSGPTAPELILAHSKHAQPYLEDGTLVMGRQSYFAPTVHKYRGDENRVVIGNFCSVAEDSHFYVGGMHPIHWVTTYGLREMFDLPGAFGDEMPMSHGDIVVGHDCWITEGSTILSGVTIGNGAVVATRAVVTADVRPYSIVAGNPAREIAMRFSPERIAALERIQWWDWPLEQILDRCEWLNGKAVEDFIAEFDPGAGSASPGHDVPGEPRANPPGPAPRG